MMRFCSLIFACFAACAGGSTIYGADVMVPDYSAVQAIFDKHCADCHAAQEPEKKLVMESFETLMMGGESGPPIIAGKSADSLLVKMIEGRIERDGKKLIMPPGKRKKLDTNEIALIRAWIDAGAKPPTQVAKRVIDVPKIEPKVPPPHAINALAYSPSNTILAVARDGVVDLLSASTRARLRSLGRHRGAVNAVVFSADGKQLFAAAGDAGIGGEIRQWNVENGERVRTLEGHNDAIYSLALSPDGKLLASGSYDQKIKFWNVEKGAEVRTLSGHNGAVFGLSFRGDGKILASASADRTIKLWDVTAGERRDTLSQPLKEQYAVAFSHDGKRLVAGGADNRVRLWEISENAAETTNPLLESRFAHEGAILRLIFSLDGGILASSSDDKTVKLWHAADLKERRSLEKQPDWPAGLALVDNKMVIVGRLDGTLQFYDTESGKVAPPPVPAISYLEPRGVQRGVATEVRLVGTNLANLAEVRFSNSNLTARLIGESNDKNGEAWIEIKTAADLRPGPYEIWVAGGNGESGNSKLYVDTLPQFVETNSSNSARISLDLPINVWAAFESPGDSDQFDFSAKASQTLIFDLQAKTLSSKANPVLTLVDASGKVLASNNDFDGTDPFIAHKFAADGTYTIRVTELMLAGSTEHFYRLSIGELPFVAAVFPSSVPSGKESEIQLIGYNLPAPAVARVKPEKPGETEVPIETFRSRRTFKIVASNLAESIESEPNDAPANATLVTPPAAIGGQIWSNERGHDVDLFHFDAKKGQKWIIETQAAQNGSPVDTRIDVLHADGKPVERMVLEASRDTMINFRAIDSNASGARLDNWEEMELNQYLYLNGEVVRLFRTPQGPDSEMLFYTAGGKRRAYFDTSAIAHALDEPGYIVEARQPGAPLAANGLPMFTLNYANDDDAERKLGADSRIYFTTPKDGAYLVRVADSRGESGERYVYRLLVREPKPDFKVTLSPMNPAIDAGSGHEFTLAAERIDGFDGEIAVNIDDLPKGFTASTPLVIQAGHYEAKGTLHATPDAPKPDGTNAMMSRLVATAQIDGKTVKHDVKNFGAIKLGDAPKLYVMLEPDVEGGATNRAPLELTIAPGQTIPAMLRIKRNGHQDLVTFTVENLPHGIIVDNIGLNGVLIPKGENERQIFIMAPKWVPETDRWCYAIEGQAGKQTSLPVILHVRKPGSKLAASSK